MSLKCIFNKTLAIFLPLSFLATSYAIAQTDKEKRAAANLYKEIIHMDSLLFDAFNSQNIEKLKVLFSTDVEFYHDTGGLTEYKQTIENFKKLFEQNKGLRRTLIPGSVEIYPIKEYGAIQIGSHRFCHVENGKDDCGTFKFTNIWHKDKGVWKLRRVISYDH